MKASDVNTLVKNQVLVVDGEELFFELVSTARNYRDDSERLIKVRNQGSYASYRFVHNDEIKVFCPRCECQVVNIEKGIQKKEGDKVYLLHPECARKSD